MFAIIESGGKQYKIQEGDTILVDLFEAPADSKVVFDKVLMLGQDDKITVGKPTIENVTVSGEYLSDEKGKKLDVFKMKRRKSTRTYNGHRQKYSMVKIVKILTGTTQSKKKADDQQPAKPEAAPKPAPKPQAKKTSEPAKDTKSQE